MQIENFTISEQDKLNTILALHAMVFLFSLALIFSFLNNDNKWIPIGVFVCLLFFAIFLGVYQTKYKPTRMIRHQLAIFGVILLIFATIIFISFFIIKNGFLADRFGSFLVCLIMGSILLGMNHSDIGGHGEDPDLNNNGSSGSDDKEDTNFKWGLALLILSFISAGILTILHFRGKLYSIPGIAIFLICAVIITFFSVGIYLIYTHRPHKKLSDKERKKQQTNGIIILAVSIFLIILLFIERASYSLNIGNSKVKTFLYVMACLLLIIGTSMVAYFSFPDFDM